MPKDLVALLKHFKTTGFKNGDLVITAEVHRVTDVNWCRKEGSHGIAVSEAAPVCQSCARAKRKVCAHERIMGTGGYGQHFVMKLR